MASKELPDIIKKRIRIADLAGAGTSMVIVVLTLVIGVLPLRRQAFANVQQSTEYKNKLQQLDGLSKTLTQVEADLEKTKGRLAEAESRLPSRGAMDDFMRQLAKVADQTGLSVEGINPREPRDAGDYKIMPVTIAGEASFENCYKFLTGLRKMDRLTRLDDLVIEKIPSNNKASVSPAKCRISVSISTFMAR